METVDVLRFFDDAAKSACFDYYWERLHRAGDLDLEALRVCIKLLPSRDQRGELQGQLHQLVLDAVSCRPYAPTALYELVEICLEDESFGQGLFAELLKHLQNLPYCSFEQQLQKSLAYLDFLKNAFWLPQGCEPFLNDDLVRTLCNLIGISSLDDAAHDALSSLLSRSAKSSSEGRILLKGQLWDRMQRLEQPYVESSSKLFRTWFQWTTIAAQHDIQSNGLQDPMYWQYLRLGLQAGFADQLKYCLGILRSSLSMAKADIDNTTLTYRTARRQDYIQQYETYSALFQIIVLDRYPNQVLACLPELTKLFGAGSLVSPAWVTALLSSALDLKVQDGVRKLVGRWYIDYIVREYSEKASDTVLDEHIPFLVEGFLPWATQGALFTSSLVSTRDRTFCPHGESLSRVVSTFFQCTSEPGRRSVLSQVLRFILDRGGRIYQYAIVYLVQGLLDGSRRKPRSTEVQYEDLAMITSMSRLTGLPEIASHLLVYLCAELCQCLAGISALDLSKVSGYDVLQAQYNDLHRGVSEQDRAAPQSGTGVVGNADASSLHTLDQRISDSQHRLLHDACFVPASKEVISILNTTEVRSGDHGHLYNILEAFWEEADRQEFRRPIAISSQSLILHQACLRAYMASQSDPNAKDAPLHILMSTAVQRLSALAQGRMYVLSALAISLHKACLSQHGVLQDGLFDDFLLHFIRDPPIPKTEFLFEAAAGEQLQAKVPGRDYESYYGKREWHAYANIIDLLNRFPESEIGAVKKLLERLVEPWRTQEKPIPIISKWKRTFQLQSMLLLVESCVSETDAAWYLDTFMKALVVEQWPRFRFLLEWIIARIYYRHPTLADRMLSDLAKLDEASPIQIASLMKIAVLSAPFLDSEDFALQLMNQLIPLSASQKVQIRHEAHWSFPIIFELAEQRSWSQITQNPAFAALNAHIRGLDKFNIPAWTIRTLRLDVVNDFTLVNIFQGEYLTIENPETEIVAYEDFVELWENDKNPVQEDLPMRVPLGRPKQRAYLPELASSSVKHQSTAEPSAVPTSLQTKASQNLTSLIASSGPTSSIKRRPASVIVIASLIDNPTNLGGLSRISESFGLEALYVNSTKVLASKDFQATAVTSHKHLPIHELKIDDVPADIIEFKRRGYEVVAVEQTDRSGILGQAAAQNALDDVGTAQVRIGTLPEKCVLVLGSEKEGVTSEVLAVVDRCVEIKTVGVTRSLNVQTAAGIAVFEWWREWGANV